MASGWNLWVRLEYIGVVSGVLLLGGTVFTRTIRASHFWCATI